MGEVTAPQWDAVRAGHEDRSAERRAGFAVSYAQAEAAMKGTTSPAAAEVAVPGTGGDAVLEPGPASVAAAPRRPRPDAPLLLRATLEHLGLLLTDYVEFPSRSAVVAVVLWLAQAAARDSDRNPIWRAYPRLLLTSQQNGSGKSTVADIARITLRCRCGRPSKITPYGVAKVFGTFKEAAILDDAQNVFRSSKAGLDLLSIMVNGYTPGATWVSGKDDGKVEPASGPMIIVGKDALITKRAEDLADLLARSVIVRLERPGVFMDELDDDGAARALAVGEALTAVTGVLQDDLKATASALARELRGKPVTDPNGPRTRQIWRPLLAVARVAGGPWVEAAEEAREELTAASGDLYSVSAALEELTGNRTEGRSFWDLPS